MKKIWSVPEAIAEQFAANEYVAACHDMNRVYKFECNSPAGSVHYYNNSDGVIDGYGSGSTTELGGYSPCGKKHEAPTSSSFYDGFVDRNGNDRCDSGEEAIIWVEYGSFWGQTYVDDWHATDKLNMNEWETAKS